MHQPKVTILFLFFLFWTTFSYAQKEHLIIGRTTGSLAVTSHKTIRTFGFTNALAAPVTLPGYTINAKVGDSIAIDFWNISQGNPISLYCKEIDFQQKDSDQKRMSKKEPIHHMEHGFYSFVAEKPGTYLYYSPENYPFHLQAGMFGIIVIEPKVQVIPKDTTVAEVLWCSHEIDSKWHTDALMGTEYDPNNTPIPIPKYAPNFYAINGKAIATIPGLLPVKDARNKVVLRLVNAGLYTHKIIMPSKVKIELLNIKSLNNNLLDDYIITLMSGETKEVVLTLPDHSTTKNITYQFIEPTSKKICHTTTIPLRYP